MPSKLMRQALLSGSRSKIFRWLQQPTPSSNTQPKLWWPFTTYQKGVVKQHWSTSETEGVEHKSLQQVSRKWVSVSYLRNFALGFQFQMENTESNFSGDQI